MKEAGLDADAVKERREKEAYPVIQDFEKWMNSVANNFAPKSRMKNYLFCGNHDAAVRAAIVYSLFACCKAHDVEIRPWLEDTLKRLPTEKDITMLLPENWHPVTAK